MCLNAYVSVLNCFEGWEMKSQLGLACQLDLQVLCQFVQELKGVQVVSTFHTANRVRKQMTVSIKVLQKLRDHQI